MLDTKKEHIAVTEANKLGIPVVAVVDTNVDPELVQYPIPGNDDAIRANSLLARVIADAVEEGRFIAAKRDPGSAPVARTAEEEAEFDGPAGRGPREAARGPGRSRAPPRAAQAGGPDDDEPTEPVADATADAAETDRARRRGRRRAGCRADRAAAAMRRAVTSSPRRRRWRRAAEPRRVERRRRCRPPEVAGRARRRRERTELNEES